MFQLVSFTWYFIVQTFGIAIAFLAAAVLLYILLRRLHSQVAALLLVAIFIGISVFFYIPNGIPRGLGYSSFVTTYGPSGGPGLPFSNVAKFISNFSKFEQVPDIARNPNDLPPPLTRTATTTVHVDITAKEVISQIAPGVYQNYWTYDGTVPGPFERIMVGDTVVVTFHNDPTSLHHHTIDFHSVIGPGGGASVLMAMPGETKTLTFTALHPGLFIYHCAEPDAALHMAHGQYGLMLVEPKGGLPNVDKEFYVVQGEFYTTGALGQKGLQIFDSTAFLDGKPQYVVFNGRTGALTSTSTMQASVGQTVRIYFGNADVNLISSFHVIGEIFDHVYEEGSLTSPPLTDVQTTLVPAGGATVVDFKLREPGNYMLVDHALARMDRGAWGILHVDGPADPSIFSGVVQPMAGH
ncbi:MAG TPA: copper-containing nitrite reductase [Candidatus Paceibacterota bacterium]|nr:copper-containing nitrite reductase [Candidatus Paceibacterota bacterium]